MEPPKVVGAQDIARQLPFRAKSLQLIAMRSKNKLNVDSAQVH